LFQDFPVLARGRLKNAGQRFSPQPQEIQGATALLYLAALFRKDILHLATIVLAEIEGHYAKQDPENAL
jgi:hypothetical protein